VHITSQDPPCEGSPCAGQGPPGEGPTSQEPPGEGPSCTGQGPPCEGPPWFICIYMLFVYVYIQGPPGEGPTSQEPLYICYLYMFIYRGLMARDRLVRSLLARGLPAWRGAD
jgi:hypothetical protein